MTEHPVSYEDLIALALGDRSTDRNDAMTAHIATCPECAATLARFAAVRSTVQIDAIAGPSVAAMSRVRGLIAGRAPAVQPSLAESVRRVLGKLAFDGRQGYALAGLRGTADAYLLSYDVEGASLDLQVEPPDDPGSVEWQITGQLDRGASLDGPGDVIAMQDSRTIATARADIHGVFSFALPAGLYHVEIRTPAETFVFEEVEVG